jgi:hypothetical protein
VHLCVNTEIELASDTWGLFKPPGVNPSAVKNIYHIIIALPSSGSVPGVFWEVLSWEAVGVVLWMCVLYVVTQCARPQCSVDYSSVGRLSEDAESAP